MKKILLTLLILVVLLFPQTVLAKIGVGVGLGKIQIDEQLSPGGIYKLPSLPVLNTGDEEGDYEVEVTYLSDQKEFLPESTWFTFSPQKFSLKPGASQQVEVSLALPVKSRPGDYFAFLEAHPVAKGEGVTIGVAAATKLNFTVKPSGVLGAAIERVRSLLEQTRPTSYLVLAIIAGLILVAVGQRYLNIRVGLRRRGKEKPTLPKAPQDGEEKV